MTDDFGDAAIIKRKTQYYEEAFATRGSHNSPQERVVQDSVVVIELKTNYKACPIQAQARPWLILGFRSRTNNLSSSLT